MALGITHMISAYIGYIMRILHGRRIKSFGDDSWWMAALFWSISARHSATVCSMRSSSTNNSFLLVSTRSHDALATLAPTRAPIAISGSTPLLEKIWEPSAPLIRARARSRGFRLYRSAKFSMCFQCSMAGSNKRIPRIDGNIVRTKSVIMNHDGH